MKTICLLFAVCGLASLSSADDVSVAAVPDNCLWNGPYLPSGDLYVDNFANYWSFQVTIPVGAVMSLNAQFPHSRYISFASYSTAGQAQDNLNDQSIIPDAGSINPYIAGASRTSPNRNFAITIATGSRPSSGAPANTLFSGRSDNTATVFYRNYVSDNGFDETGGAPLPKVNLLLANGTTLIGTNACTALSAQSVLLTSPKPNFLIYLLLRATELPTSPGIWNNTPLVLYATLLQNFLYGTPDNAYIQVSTTRNFGSVVVLSGKIPTTPTTLAGDATMGTGQLRYWSLCSYEYFTQSSAGCIFDQSITTDANGNYVIVVSRTADKPSNAIASCGRNWLQWSDAGDGNGNTNDGMLMMRNMLPDPSFTQAIQDATIPGTSVIVPGGAAAVMGPYLPTVTYTSTAAFEALGC